MKANLDIEFATAFEGCAENCRFFEVDVDKYYANGKVFSVVCTCKNIELCEHLAKYLKDIEEVARNEYPTGNQLDPESR